MGPQSPEVPEDKPYGKWSWVAPVFMMFGTFVLLYSFSPPEQEATNAPTVAVSIKPLHSIVAGIMDGVSSPQLIMSGMTSPHDYALKPSDARLLEKADVIFWIGPAMEASLVKPLSIISEKSRVVAMAPNEADPHIWLDPENVITMIDDITAQLNIADPYNEDRYTQNAVRMKERIEALNIDLRQRLTTVSHKSIIVYHDAYNHFAKSFGLNIAGTFAPTPDQRPGAARISAIRQMMASGGVHCLFKEPQFDAAILTTAIEGIDGARIADLDPIGTGLTPDKDLYFNLMKSNVEAIRSCLSETP